MVIADGRSDPSRSVDDQNCRGAQLRSEPPGFHSVTRVSNRADVARCWPGSSRTQPELERRPVHGPTRRWTPSSLQCTAEAGGHRLSPPRQRTRRRESREPSGPPAALGDGVRTYPHRSVFEASLTYAIQRTRFLGSILSVAPPDHEGGEDRNVGCRTSASVLLDVADGWQSPVRH